MPGAAGLPTLFGFSSGVPGEKFGRLRGKAEPGAQIGGWQPEPLWSRYRMSVLARLIRVQPWGAGQAILINPCCVSKLPRKLAC